MGKKRTLKAPHPFLKNGIEKRKPLCKTTNWDEHFDTSNIKIGLEITEEFH